MADLTTLQGWLADAEAAKHKLMIGQLEVTVSYEGKSVSFAQADRDRLDAYIADLRRQIDALTGVPRRRGPVQFAF